jgi:hypothetical protein
VVVAVELVSPPSLTPAGACAHAAASASTAAATAGFMRVE